MVENFIQVMISQLIRQKMKYEYNKMKDKRNQIQMYENIKIQIQQYENTNTIIEKTEIV